MEKKYIEDKQGNRVLPITHVRAVLDDYGNNVSSLLGAKTDESAFTEHTSDTSIHHTHTNKSILDSISGTVGTMAYENTDSYYTKSETSGATELTTAFNLKANVSDLNAYFNDAKYENSGTTKVINFYHGNTIKATIDASDFIKDGMIESVTIEAKSGTTYLVITWNTDAGKTKTELNIGDIFEADNYYNKTAIDTLVGSGFTSSSITDAIIENEEITSAALTDLDNRKLDATAYTPTDLSNYYKKSETSGATEISNALGAKVNTSDIITAITPSNSGSTNPIATKVVAELSTAFGAINTSIEDLSGQSETISVALNNLNDEKLDVTAYTPIDVSNYYKKSETSGATELSTAFGAINTSIEDLSGQSETISTALNDLNQNKADKSTTYTKAEIDSMIGDIETLLATI